MGRRAGVAAAACVSALALALALAACGERDGAGSGERTGAASEPLALATIKPLAQVYVTNAGALDVETQYLPQVVCCENGAAPKGALEAQAVMARTYMYFRVAADGLGTQAKPFAGTQADQAYHCPTSVSQACKDAVGATHDMITAYKNAKGELVANVSFFVDGPRPACLASKSCTCAMPAATVSMSPTDHPQGCDCFTFSSQGLANPAFVTYNWSHTGAAVKGSTLGDPANESNRGCASQNIQACLSYAGWSYVDQLRFFYGQDIGLYHPDGTSVDLGDDGGGSSSGGPPGPSSDGGSSYLGANGDKGDASSGGCAIARAPRRAGGGRLVALVAFVALGLALAHRRSRA